MPKALDLTEQRFGQLIAKYRVPNKGKKTYWHCLCDCGREKDIQTSHLTNGLIVNCGCGNRQEDNFTKNFIKKELQCPICNQFFIQGFSYRYICFYFS